MSAPATESEWAADRRVGFAMGILLVGIVAALFFRNEPLAVEETPSVDRAEQINERLRDRNISVYEDSSSPAAPAAGSAKNWTLRDLLSDLSARDRGVVLPIGERDRPKPARTAPAGTEESVHRPLPPPHSQPPEIAGVDPIHTETSEVFRHADAPDADSAGFDSPPESDFDEYTVRYGDTLSGIAAEFLGSSGRYRDIYEANRDRMASPDHLRVGAALRIPRY